MNFDQEIMVSPRESESRGSGADVGREEPIELLQGEGEVESTETMKSVRELAAAVLQQTHQNAQILQLTRDHQIHQQQRETTQNDAGLTAFLKGKPPQFKGDFDPEGAEHWIQELEKIFAVMRCREDRKVGYGAFMLTGDAENWWKGKSRLVEEERRIITWDLFRECFLEKYFPRLTKREKEREFDRLRQGGMTVGEYARKFENLLKYSEFYQLLPREEWMCQRFQDGLKHEIQRAIAPLHLVKFPDLVERCMEVESIDSRRGQVSSGGQGRPGSQRGGPIRRDSGSRFQQGRGGPYTRQMQQITGAGVGGGVRQLALKCYFCDGTHLSRDCPRKIEGLCVWSGRSHG